jgi:hypothetical protein
MADKESWVAKEVDRPVETEPVTATVKPSKNWLEQMCDFTLNLMNMVLTVAVAGLIAAGSYFAYPLFNQPNFSEAQAFLNQDGNEQAGEILTEMAKTCQNGTKTPHACKLLYYSRLAAKQSEQKQLSQAPQHSTVRTAQ